MVHLLVSPPLPFPVTSPPSPLFSSPLLSSLLPISPLLTCPLIPLLSSPLLSSPLLSFLLLSSSLLSSPLLPLFHNLLNRSLRPATLREDVSDADESEQPAAGAIWKPCESEDLDRLYRRRGKEGGGEALTGILRLMVHERRPEGWRNRMEVCKPSHSLTW
eukprot:756348-Hanusia_phi.AAC.2